MKTQMDSAAVQRKKSTTDHGDSSPWRSGLSKKLASFNLSTLVVLLIIAVTPAWVQAIPGFLEGGITDVNVTARTARVNGVLMNIPVGTPMTTPTVDLQALAVSRNVNPLTLIALTPLPGLPSGFIGGTCLCATEVDPVTGIVTATNMIIEPKENVLIATVTTHICTTQTCDPDVPGNELRVGGILMDPNEDPRLISDPTTNRGFEVDLRLGNLVGVTASGEGYVGEDARLHLYLLDISGGILVNAGTTEVSILRARCRQRGDMADWTVLGATHDPGTGTVTFIRSDTMEVLGTTPLVADATDPKFGAYLFSNDVMGTCTDSITATFGTVSATSGVDIRGGAMALAPAPTAATLQTRPLLGNALPVTSDDFITTVVNVGSTFGKQFLLSNDTDPDGDTLMLISVEPTSKNGGTIVDNLDGTFTYMPGPGYNGPDTFAYLIADGFKPAVTGAVNVDVQTPTTDTLVVQRALFQAGTGAWRVQGTSSIIGQGNTVTIYLGAKVGGSEIGTVTVDALGGWEFRGQSPTISLGTASTISVNSTFSGLLQGFPIAFK